MRNVSRGKEGYTVGTKEKKIWSKKKGKKKNWDEPREKNWVGSRRSRGGDSYLVCQLSRGGKAEEISESTLRGFATPTPINFMKYNNFSFIIFLFQNLHFSSKQECELVGTKLRRRWQRERSSWGKEIEKKITRPQIWLTPSVWGSRRKVERDVENRSRWQCVTCVTRRADTPGVPTSISISWWSGGYWTASRNFTTEF